MHPISLLIKPASGLCNMRCDYCFYCDEMQNRETGSYGIMNVETLEPVIKKTMEFATGTVSIAFQGGEPTLAGPEYFRAAVDFVKQYNTRRLRVDFALQTNGFAIDEAWARFFKDNGFLIGLSIDGPRKCHDAYRRAPDGSETFHRILETADLFDRVGVQYNILTVVNRRTAGAVKQMYSFFKKRGFSYQQYIACLDPIGEAPGGREYSLTPADYGRFLCTLFDLWYEDLQTGSQPYIRAFENYVGILLGQQPESCDMRGVCGMQYVVEADGAVYPCDFYVLDDYRLGSFVTGGIEDFDAQREALGFVAQSQRLPEACAACEYALLCRGGCRRNRQEGPQGYENFFCESYKMFFAHSGARLAHIAQVLQAGR